MHLLTLCACFSGYAELIFNVGSLEELWGSESYCGVQLLNECLQAEIISNNLCIVSPHL